MLKLLKQHLSDFRLRRPPRWMVYAAIIAVVASWVPLVLIARARTVPSTSPRILIPQDMGKQPKYREQTPSRVFADGRADRQTVSGTVSRADLVEDDHYYRGYVAGRSGEKWEAKFFAGLPPQVPLTDKLLARGQERYGIYCATCHGIDGYGNGPTAQRATDLQEARWIPPTSLHKDEVRAQEDGRLFNTITNGIRNMPAYGPQIAVEDRWAIVAYIRALQLSQHATIADVPPEKRATLR